jgi:hypothetical protein
MYNATAARSITISAWTRAAGFPGHSTIGGYETVFSKGDTSWTLQKFRQTQSLMGKREWDGIIDEVRVFSTAKDANWIKLEFESQKEGSKFLTFGQTQTAP